MHPILRNPPAGDHLGGVLQFTAPFLNRQTHTRCERLAHGPKARTVFPSILSVATVSPVLEGQETPRRVPCGFPLSQESSPSPNSIGGFKLVTMSQKPKNARRMSVMKPRRLQASWSTPKKRDAQEKPACGPWLHLKITIWWEHSRESLQRVS